MLGALQERQPLLTGTTVVERIPAETRYYAEVTSAPPYVEVDELGLCGAMASLAMLQAGAVPGFQHPRRLAGRAGRLCATDETCGVSITTCPTGDFLFLIHETRTK